MTTKADYSAWASTDKVRKPLLKCAIKEASYARIDASHADDIANRALMIYWEKEAQHSTAPLSLTRLLHWLCYRHFRASEVARGVYRVRDLQKDNCDLPEVTSDEGFLQLTREPSFRLMCEDGCDEVFRAIPSKYCRVFYLRFNEGMSIADIAEHENVAIQTVHNYLEKAGQCLERELPWFTKSQSTFLGLRKK